MLLTPLAILIAALLVVGVVADRLPRRVVIGIVVGIAAVVVVTAIAAIGLGTSDVTPALPFGPSGLRVHLALDPLAASFLLLLFLVAPFGEIAPVRWAATGLAVLAGDACTLSASLILLGWPTSLRTAVGSAVCLMVALAVAVPSGDFETFRAMPPDGWRAVGVLSLVLVGAGLLIRIAPLLGTYLLLRVLLDLSGPAVPLWWGVPLAVAGAAIAVIGAWRAACEDTIGSVAIAGSLQPLGLAIIGIGLALFARAVDLPAVASLALQAVWLSLLVHGLGRAALLSCAGAVDAGAGTQHLSRLGGLINAMPVTACCCLAALFGGVALPPSLGFAGFWLLFQTLFATARIGELELQVLVAAVAAIAAASTALAAFAAVRLFGVAFLGRPRTPRSAVAADAPRDRQVVMMGLSGLTVLLGVVPAVALLAAAGWTQSSHLSLELRTGQEAPGYAPAAIAALLAIVCLGIVRIRSRGMEQRREPAWTGGFAAPPAWLPFGDPATQYGPDSFSEPLQRGLSRLPVLATPRQLLADAWAAARHAVIRLVPP